MRGIREAAVAEFLGTFALCFIGAGVVCVNEWAGHAAGLVGIAMAHGAVLAVMICALGHLSGGHFNPAVTLGVFVANRLEGRRALVYIAAQLAGAVAAAYGLRFLVPANVWPLVHLGTPALGAGVTVGKAVLIECVLTFFLVLTVFGTAVDPKGNGAPVAGFAIGTVLVFDILFGGPLTGAAMNPARAFGPALASGNWSHHLVYWLGPLSGGVLAGVLYPRLFLHKP